MGMNQTPTSERVHISFFGRRNAGKSSVMNAVTGQDLAVVSDVKGTTTDPVYKTMELLPLGPVVMIDTPGIDDEGELGALRIRKSYQVLNKTDAAVLVIDAIAGPSPEDFRLIQKITDKKIPYLVALNKADLANQTVLDTCRASLVSPSASEITVPSENILSISASTQDGIWDLKEALTRIAKIEDPEQQLVGDLIEPSDFIVLVVPIDSAAPKGRLILPQQQMIRDILESNATAIVVKENELAETLKNIGKKPKLVITDSQAFGKVSPIVPEDIPLTSFSILFARYKGNLASTVAGVTAIDQLQDGDKVLISEGCTHHRQCDDIGSVKMPRWLKNYTKKELVIEMSSGTGFPDDLSQYKLIIHCGGCMLNEREMKYRLSCAADQGVPMTNYGIAIAYMHGILKRSVEVFPQIAALL